MKSEVKKVKTLSVMSFISAIVSGIFLGTIFSFIVTFYDWYRDGFNVANNRLVNMASQDESLIEPFNDTMFYAVGLSIIQKTQHLSQTINTHLPKGFEANSAKPNFLTPMTIQISKGKHALHELWVLIQNTFMMMIAKLSLFLLALPFLVLCFLLGMVDGLVRREIRIAEYAREQGSLFLKWMHPVRWLVTGSLILYFVVDWVSSPIPYFLIASLVVLGLTSTMTSFLKKYL